jgi:hypothetical protein
MKAIKENFKWHNSTQIEFSIFHRVFLLLSETRATVESMTTAVDTKWKSGGSPWKLQLKTRPACNLITASSPAFPTRFVSGYDQRVCLSSLRAFD